MFRVSLSSQKALPKYFMPNLMSKEPETDSCFIKTLIILVLRQQN